MTRKFRTLLTSIILVLLAIPVTSEAADSIQFVGSFSQSRSTEEHYYTYQIDFWREGEKAFGFYTFVGGLYGNGNKKVLPWRIVGSVVGNEVVLKGEHVHFKFAGTLSKKELSGRWSDSMTAGRNINLIQQSKTAVEPALLHASLRNYISWEKWAERYLDVIEANDKQLSRELEKCEKGVASSCVGAGNHAALRGNREKARKLHEAGCKLNNATACRFSGNVKKARQINVSRCTGKATMDNNFACLALGRLEEKAGNPKAAREWYRKGCNNSIPNVCLALKRLDTKRVGVD